MAIDALLREERRFPPPQAFAAKAQVTARDVATWAPQAGSPEFWAELARNELHWERPFETILDDSSPPFYRWFPDGRLSASAQCLDRHLGTEVESKVAIQWEAEDGPQRTYTYRQLHDEVCRAANALRALGVEAGDRVVIYMPMVPEAIIAMHACARIAAVHAVVFGGFSAETLADRIEDAGATVLITADGAYRGGRVVPLKQHADAALDRVTCIEHVLVVQRTGDDVPWVGARDHWWHDAVAGQDAACDPVIVDAEHPLFILHTSGSTGKPKGLVHTTGGYMAWARASTRWVFDLRDDDVYWCTADIGWITGHTYMAYGPLANGATQVIYEGAPMHPEPDRFWDIIERHNVTVFYTAPTAIRALMQKGDDWVTRHNRSSLRLLGSVGEPINPEAWIWYHDVVGEGRCPIVDTWWQTETGGIVLSPLPGATTLKPGSCSGPLPGFAVDILDGEGQPVTDPGQGGHLVMTHPFPSMARTIWGNDDRFVETYWSRYGPTTYDAGDTARRDADGDLWIMGRADDVLNVSGHRLGTMEVESALVAHPDVAEAAVVGRPHDIKGEALSAFVVLRSGRPDERMAQSLRAHVAHAIGPIAKPDDIRFAEVLPKTRSGKIMRRILRAVARDEDVTQDLSTLEAAAPIQALREAPVL